MSNPYANAQSWADPNQQGTPWPAPSPPRSHGLSVTALVVSGVALLLSVVTLLILALSGGGSYTLRGTAPQVVLGQPYPGPRLAAEVTAVLQDDEYEVSAMHCPATQAIAPGVRATCTGRIDGGKDRVEVSFTDTAGHFTLDLP